MQRILVATDFSTRSDRALRRAALLARTQGAQLLLLHVVDNDQAPELVRSAQRESASLLAQLAATLRQVDGVACEVDVRIGEPFEEIAAAADKLDADCIVMGPHRRQALQDIFVGTTVERTMRASHRPLLMANGVPAGPYGGVLLTTDFSAHSRHAITEAERCGLLTGVRTAIVHAYMDPAGGMLGRSNLSRPQLEAHMAELAASANAGLRDFLAESGLSGTQAYCDFAAVSPAAAILERARQKASDLVVVGTRGAGALQRVLLGSVAEDILRNATIDVFVVPQAQA